MGEHLQGTGASLDRMRQTITHPAFMWFLAAAVNAPMLVARAGTLAESDTFWQIRTGITIIDTGSLPQTDPFSWTAFGAPWNVNSWAFDVLLGACYLAGGLPAVAYACAALAGAACVLVLESARRLGASPFLAGASIFLASPALIGWFSARPQLIDYSAVPVLVLLLRRIVDGGSAWRGVLGVALLTIVWVNLHAAVLLGFLIVAAVLALTLAVRQYRGRAPWCLAALAACGAGALVNPYGVGLIGQTLQVGSSSSGVVAEWMPLSSADIGQWAMFVIGVVAFLAAALRRDFVSAVALGVLAATSVAAVRTLPILLLVALPVLAAAASRPEVLRYLRTRRVVLIPGALTAVVAFGVLFASRGLGQPGVPDSGVYSAQVVNALPHGSHVFNSYQIGGFILLERPDVRVSFDSRNDLYGAQATLNFSRILDGRGDPAADLVGADSVLVPPDSGLAAQLSNAAGWKRSAEDSAAVLFIRS